MAALREAGFAAGRAQACAASTLLAPALLAPALLVRPGLAAACCAPNGAAYALSLLSFSFARPGVIETE